MRAKDGEWKQRRGSDPLPWSHSLGRSGHRIQAAALVPSQARDTLSGREFELVALNLMAEGSYGRVDRFEITPIAAAAERGSLRSSSTHGPRIVAIKSVRSQRDDRGLEALRHENAVLQELRHRNIVRVEAVFEAERPGEPPIVAQECIEGPSLASVLSAQDKLPPHKKLYSLLQATRWALGLASALEYLHSGNSSHMVIHRDVSTANLILTSHKLANADIKLVDFGLSTMPPRRRSSCEGESEYTQGNGQRSASLDSPSGGRVFGRQADGMMQPVEEADSLMTGLCGTLLHTAPEMMTGCYNCKVDVFSFGIILYQLVTYASIVNTLHRGGSTVKDGHQRMQAGWRPYIPHTVPDVFAALIRRCWAADPADRPGFHDISEELHLFHHELALTEGKPRSRSLFSWLGRCVAGSPADQEPSTTSSSSIYAGYMDASLEGSRNQNEPSNQGMRSSDGDESVRRPPASAAASAYSGNSFSGIPALAPHIVHALRHQQLPSQQEDVQVQ